MATARILVVDDDPSILKSICRLLHSEGYKVLSASGPRQALEILQSEPSIDLVISDVEMPEMRGPELLHEIAQISPSTVYILISGHVQSRPLVPPFLQKPFKPHELFSTVERVLQTKNAGLALEEVTKRTGELSGEGHHLRVEMKRAVEEAHASMDQARKQKDVDDLCRKAMKILGCQVFFNYMVDQPANRLHLNACAGIPDDEARKIEWLDYGVAVCGCVAQTGERIIAEGICSSSDARTDLVRSYGIQAYCCHPLKTDNRLVGTLSFGTRARPRFDDSEIEMMRMIAHQVSYKYAEETPPKR